MDMRMFLVAAVGMFAAAECYSFCTDDLSKDPAVREYWKFDDAKNKIEVECVGGAGGILSVSPDGVIVFNKTNDVGTVYLRAIGAQGIPLKTQLRFSVNCSCTNALPLESQLELMGEVNGKFVYTNP